MVCSGLVVIRDLSVCNVWSVKTAEYFYNGMQVGTDLNKK